MKSKYKIKLSKQILPNGFKKTFQMIDHPGAVLIIPFVSVNKIILLKQYRPSIRKYIYELPCGTIDKGENPLQCARRELIEETGYQAKHFRRLGYIYPAPGYTNEIVYIFQAQELRERAADKDPDEIIEILTVNRREIRQMVSNHSIKDAKTICALVHGGIFK